MLFLKVGKAKHKFKLKIVIAKYKYLPQEQIPKNGLFKVKVTRFKKDRGSHQIEIFSIPSKKSSIKFPKNQQIIPMTLFYNNQSNQYLQKIAEIKTYLCDQNGNVVRTIGKTELNIAQFASKEKFALQVEIEGESKKIQQDVVITLQMILQRQDDDSKSVVSEDQLQLRSVQLKRQDKSQNKGKSKSKDKKSYLFPSTAQSQVTVKSAEDGKLKHSGVTQSDEKLSQKVNKNNDRRRKSPIRQLQENTSKNQDHRRDEESCQDESFFSRLTNKLSQASGRKQVQTKKQVQRKDKENKTLKQEQKSQQAFEQNQNNEDDQSRRESIEFKLHMAMKKVGSLQRQNSQLRSQTYRLKQIIEQLIEQKNQRSTTQTSSNSKMERQIEQLKKSLIEKEMKINQLQGLNKLVAGRQGVKQGENKGLKKEVGQLKSKLQFEKNKLAKVLQTAMQSQNMQLLQIIEKQLSDDFY